MFNENFMLQVVLISPLCSLPEEVAHVTLHGLGLDHVRGSPFHEEDAKNVLFNDRFACENMTTKYTMFYTKLEQPAWRTGTGEELSGRMLTALPDVRLLRQTLLLQDETI